MGFGAHASFSLHHQAFLGLVCYLAAGDRWLRLDDARVEDVTSLAGIAAPGAPDRWHGVLGESVARGETPCLLLFRAAEGEAGPGDGRAEGAPQGAPAPAQPSGPGLGAVSQVPPSGLTPAHVGSSPGAGVSARPGVGRGPTPTPTPTPVSGHLVGPRGPTLAGPPGPLPGLGGPRAPPAPGPRPAPAPGPGPAPRPGASSSGGPGGGPSGAVAGLGPGVGAGPGPVERKWSSGQPMCMECGDVGHLQKHCPRVTCRRCGKGGHMASACGEPPGHNPGPFTAGGGEGGITCNNCGRTGHMMRSCPSIRCKVCGKLGHMGDHHKTGPRK